MPLPQKQLGERGPVVGALGLGCMTMSPSYGPGDPVEGCQLVEAYTDQDDPNRIIMWEKWASRESKEAYLAWAGETGVLDSAGALYAAEPRFLNLSPAD